MLDWNDLRYFLAVARHGSTIAAGKALAISQSTVQRRLVELEKQLGRKLVKRHQTGYRLTELGEQLLAYAERVESAVTDLERQVTASDHDLVGTIRVTCPEPLVYRLSQSQLMETFYSRYPGLKVEFVMSDRYLDLSKGDADVAIRSGELEDDVLIARKISESPWAVYASRTYVEKNGRPSSVADLNNHAVIGFEGAIANHRAARWLTSVAPNAKVVARNNSVYGLVYSVKSGVGLSPLPVALGDSEGDLVRVVEPLPELASSWHILVHPDLRHMPRVRAFFDFIVSERDRLHPILTQRLGRP